MALDDSSLDDGVLIKLVLKGVPMEQIAQVASEMGAGLQDKVLAEIRRLQEAQSKLVQESDRKGVQQKIEVEKQKLRVIEEVTRTQQEAASKVEAAQKRAADAAIREQARAAREQARVAREMERQNEQWADAINRAHKRAADEFEKQQKRMEREARIAANKTKTEWRRTMEDLENVTTVAEGIASGGVWNRLFSAPADALERFKQYMEDVAKITGLYNSATSSQASRSQMAEAAGGQISNRSIVQATNYMEQSDLKLTQEQMNLTAEAADKLAKKAGGDAAAALQTFYEVMASGNTKAVRQYGLIVDNDKAYASYAERMHTTVGAMDEQQKRQAVQIELLDQMERKMAKLPPEVDNFAEAFERTTTATQNWSDAIKVAIGNSTTLAGIWEIFTPQYYQRKALAAQSVLRESNGRWSMMTGEEALKHDYYSEQESRRFKEAMRQRRDAMVGDGMGFESDEAAPLEFADMSPEARARDIEKQIEEEKRRREQERERVRQSRLKDAQDSKATTQKKKEQLRQVESILRQSGANLGGEGGAASMLNGDEELSWLAMQAVYNQNVEGGFRSDADMGEATIASLAAGSRQELRERTVRVNDAGSARTGMKQWRASLKRDIEAYKFESDDVGVERAKQALDSLEQRQNEVLSKAGGKGLLTSLLFGPDGPDKALSEMDDFERATLDSISMVSDAGKQMAGALGQAMAGIVAGGDDEPLRKRLANITKALSAEAYTRGVMELALAAASAASYDYPAAGKHLVAAGMFAAVGTAAGLSSRALGGGSSSGGNAATSAPMRNAGSGSSSNAGGSSGNGTTNISVQLLVLPGASDNAGKAVVDAIRAHEKQSGKSYLVKAA